MVFKAVYFPFFALSVLCLNLMWRGKVNDRKFIEVKVLVCLRAIGVHNTALFVHTAGDEWFPI